MGINISAERLARQLGSFDRTPAYRGLCAALVELIGDGRLPLDARLPSERALSEVLGLSRITVTRAYADLATAGFATARRGSGTYTAVPMERRRAHDRALRPLGTAQAPDALSDDTIDLNCAASAATPGVMAAGERALARLPSYLALDGYLPSGLPELQTRIAAHYARHGLPTAAEQIIITSGALSAIAIVAHALSRPGDRVMVESPIYPNAIKALRLGGARLVNSPLTDPLGEQGWDMDAIAATLRQTAPHLAYLIPDFQNPTGFLMSDADRARYAGLLQASRTTAIIDETLRATNLSGVPMPAPFAAHAPDAITIGSASKMFWGGLRVGWIRAPLALVAKIIAARVHVDLGSSLLDQLIVDELLGDENLLAIRREQLRRRRDALAQALREHLPYWRWRLPDGGLALWVQLPPGISATRLAADMARTGVHLAPGPVFTVEGGADAWLRIPYAKPEEQLVAAVRRMAKHGLAGGGTHDSTRGERVLIA